jgi:hypothetical protein
MSFLTRLALAGVALAACLAATPAHATARVPQGFLGVVADGPLFDPRVDLGREIGVMASVGVQSTRFSIYWDAAQPYAGAQDVPPDQRGRFADEAGVPTDWAAVDRFVGLSAVRRLGLLPVVLRAPAWAREHPELPNSPPSVAGRVAYARFLAALVRRYGPRGTFWSANPRLPRMPIRRWQIWNEPAGVRDWSDQPGLPAYAKLLPPSYRAVKAADPGAQVVLAGLVGRSWDQLAELYRLGARRYFDAVAIHPFSARVSNVMKILRLARAVMRRRGDVRKSLLVTELSWPSAKGRTTVKYGFETTERGQAARLRTALGAIAADRRRLRIAAVYWSSWLSYDRDPNYSFDYSGLRRLDSDRVVAKPAYFAFRQVARRLER